jgi:hypothetical protein
MELSNSLDMAIQERVAEVAYDLAEARGFVSGGEQEDWQAAQRIVQDEIRDKLAALRSPNPSWATPLDIALQDQIAQAAYRLAEQRGFAPGHELDDWLQAENMISTEIRLRMGGAAAVSNQQDIPVPDLSQPVEAPAGTQITQQA